LPGGASLFQSSPVLDPLHAAISHTGRDVFDHRLVIGACAESASSRYKELFKVVPDPFHRLMHRHSRITVDLALQILRATLSETATDHIDTPAVHLALRCLWHNCPERWPLVMFWEAAHQNNEIGWCQNMTAALTALSGRCIDPAHIPKSATRRQHWHQRFAVNEL
jgi:hypothetical protein